MVLTLKTINIFLLLKCHVEFRWTKLTPKASQVRPIIDTDPSGADLR